MQITIIGLGQIGTSLGLALRPYRQHIRRVGLDRLLPVSGKARALGAVDRTAVNLSLAVAKADLVVLALPFSALEETLSIIGESLPSHSVVLDMVPGKLQAARWADAYLPATVGYAGVWPLLASSDRRARDDLFAGGLWLVSEHPRLTPKAWQMAYALATICGAQTQRATAEEMDAMIAQYDLLPRLLAAGLLNGVVGQPGWFDARKLAARPFAQASAALAQLDDDESLLSIIRQQPEQANKGVQALLDALANLRRHVLAGEAALESDLQRARKHLLMQPSTYRPDLEPQKALALLLEAKRS